MRQENKGQEFHKIISEAKKLELAQNFYGFQYKKKMLSVLIYNAEFYFLYIQKKTQILMSWPKLE